MATENIEIRLPNGRKISINIDLDGETVSVSGARLVQAVKYFQHHGKCNGNPNLVPFSDADAKDIDSLFVNVDMGGANNDTVECKLLRGNAPRWGETDSPTIMARIFPNTILGTCDMPSIVSHVSVGTRPEDSLKGRILPLHDHSTTGMNKLHIHPIDGSKTINGRRIRPGQALMKGDRCNGPTDWDPISEKIYGVALENASVKIYIRPA